MSQVHEAWCNAVAGALKAHAAVVEHVAPGHWTFAPMAPHALRGSARIADEWLIVDVPLPTRLASTIDGHWHAIAINAGLAGGLKLCTAAGDCSFHLRADVPLLEDTPVALRMQHLCAGIGAAIASLSAPQPADPPPTPEAVEFLASASFETPPKEGGSSGRMEEFRRFNPSAARAEEAPSSPGPSRSPRSSLSTLSPAGLGALAAWDFDLRQRCRETLWPCTDREPRTVMVQLEVPGAFQQAVVELQPERGVVVSVPLLAAPLAAPPHETAITRLLLATAGALRMVRATTRPAPASVGFEVVFAHVPTAEELAHAFAALSLAWRCAGREVEILARDVRIAQLYAGDGVEPRDRRRSQSTNHVSRPVASAHRGGKTDGTSSSNDSGTEGQ